MTKSAETAVTWWRIEDFPIGNLPLHEHQRLMTLDFANSDAVHPHAWLALGDLTKLAVEGKTTLVDSVKTPIAVRGGKYPDVENAVTAVDSFVIFHPWDFLRANESYVGGLRENVVHGEVHPSAVIEGTVHIGYGTRILPGVFIEGNVVIGDHCKIGPNCYIRGNTSIGDHCHIGQSVEIKNSVVLANTSIGHLSYVGDSVIGQHVNLGAGTITSNFRHDGGNHSSMIDGVLVDTGRRKLGAIIGDGVHTGIHTSIYPGRKLAANTATRPGAIVQRDVEI